MAATVIDAWSNELVGAVPVSYAPLPANKHYGRVRCSTFSVTLASQASGTDIALCKIPKGARIVQGEIIASATLANSATLAIGLAGADGSGTIDDVPTGSSIGVDGAAVTSAVSDAVACLKAAAAQGAAKVAFGITQALGFLYETQKEVYLTATTGTGTVATEKVTGYVKYIVD
jgi:hypothetical protein